MQYKKGYQKLARALASFWICTWVKLVRGNVIMIIVSSSFSKNFIFKNSKTQRQRFQIFSGLKSVFENLLSRDGRITVRGGLAVEIKLRLQIPPASCGRSLSSTSGSYVLIRVLHKRCLRSSRKYV